MQSTSSERDPVELLADEFVQRRRRGEMPSLTEYVERFPALASEIRAVFPAILALEKAGPHVSDVSAGLTPRRAELTRNLAEAIGDYRILREVGRGAMGVVYEAEQQSLDRRVALKVLPWHSVANAKAVERFRREARAAARLHHTNIVPVFEVGQEGEVCYFAMQFIVGQSLDNVMVELRHLQAGVILEPSIYPAEEGDRPAAGSLALSMYTEAFAQVRAADEVGGSSGARRAGGGIGVRAPSDGDRPAAETVAVKHPSTIPGALFTDTKARSDAYRAHYYRSVARIAERVADALAYAHSRGIIHRDVKPSNLMLDAAGVVWVTDFGLAKTSDESLTRSGDLLGTLRYMAPERFNGQCDARADVYSLGATLYELLCLRPARDARDGADLIAQITRSDPPPPRSIDPRIPRDLERIVLKAIERDPKLRYPSAQALAEDLRRFLSDLPILGRPVPPIERFARWAKRNRALATATVGGFALLLTGLLVSGIATAAFSAMAKQEREERVATTSNLYHSLLREAQAVRMARREGYRAQAWRLLEKARKLDTPEVDVAALRREAIGSLGDFVGKPPVVLGEFPADATAAAISPDGRIAVVGLANGVIRWYDARTGKLLEENKQHSTAVRQLKFDRSGGLLLSADAHGATRSWKPHDNHWQVKELAILGRPLLAIEPVHEGELLVVFKPLEDFSEIAVSDVAQGRRTEIHPPFTVNAVALNRNGNMLAGVGDEDVYVWNTRSGAVLERTRTELGPLESVAFSDDGKLLFCGSAQGFVVFDLPELRQQTFMRYDQVPRGAFSPEGMHIAFASVNRRVTLWSVHANRELAALAHPGWKDLHSLAFSANGQMLVSGDGETVRIWNVRGGAEKTTLSGHGAAVNGLALDAKGQRLASVGLDRHVMLWDVGTGERLAIDRLPAMGSAIAHSREANAWLVGDTAGKLHLLDGQTLRSISTTDGAVGSISAIRTAAGKPGIFVCGEQGAALWRLEAVKDGGDQSFALKNVRQLSQGDCSAAEFSPSGSFVAWNDGGRVRAAEVDSGVEWPLSGPPLGRGSQNLAFEGESDTLIFVDQRGRLVGWDIVADREEFSLSGDGAPQGAHVAASPDGRWLAVDASPTQVGVWDLQRREPLFVLREEPSAVNVTRWDAKGELLAVGAKDGSLAIWNLPAVRGQLAEIDLGWTAIEDDPEPAAAASKTPLERLNVLATEKPGHVRLRLRLAIALARSGKIADSLDHFNAIIENEPKYGEALQGRANLYARLGKWKQAADDCVAALKVNKNATLGDQYGAALLLALADDTSAYEKHCRAMLDRLADDANPADVELTLRACVLRKANLPVGELSGRLRTMLENRRPFENRGEAWLTAALAAYRQGGAYEARHCVSRAQNDASYSQSESLPALSFAVLGLVQQTDGQTSVAKESMEAAREFARRIDRPDDPLRFAIDGQDRLLFELIEKEAASAGRP